MRRTLVLIFGLFLIAATIVGLRFVVGGNEDNWICADGVWIKHGNPSAPMPTFSCGKQADQEPAVTPGSESAGLANPASVFCEEQGGKLEIQTAEDGSQSGVCKFSDGRQCDEWEFFRTKLCQ